MSVLSSSLKKFILSASAMTGATVLSPCYASAARDSVSNNSSIIQLAGCASQALRITMDSGSSRGKTEAMEALRVFASYTSLVYTPARTEDNLPAMRVALPSQALVDSANSTAATWTELQWRLKPLKTLEIACDTTQVAPPALAPAQVESERTAPKTEPFKAREAIQSSEVSIARIVDQDGQVLSEDEVDWLNDDSLGELLSLNQAKVWRETVKDSAGGLESRLIIELRDLQDDVVGRLVKSDEASTVSIEKLTGLESAKYTLAGDHVATISLRSESGMNVIFALSDAKVDDHDQVDTKEQDRIRQAQEELSQFDSEVNADW